MTLKTLRRSGIKPVIVNCKKVMPTVWPFIYLFILAKITDV